MNDYKTIRKIAEIEEYIGSAGVVSFDFREGRHRQIHPAQASRR